MVVALIRSRVVPRAASVASSCNSSARRSALYSTSADGPWSDPLPTNRPVHKYLIIAEDVASDTSAKESLQRRLSVRPQHLREAKLGKTSGRITLGGGLLSADHPELLETGRDPAQALAGSVFVVQGENIEDVRHRLQNDVYFSAGVFDPAKVRIFPFLQATLGATDSSARNASAAGSQESPIQPSLSELREKEMLKWKDAAQRTLGWLRDGGGRQNLA